MRIIDFVHASSREITLLLQSIMQQKHCNTYIYNVYLAVLCEPRLHIRDRSLTLNDLLLLIGTRMDSCHSGTYTISSNV